jgi:type III restriction enzyme
MKFQFKKQPFQAEATDAIVRIFAGQPNAGETKYRRDVGTRKGQASIEEQDAEFETAYRNADVKLSSDALLKNIHAVQTDNNIKYSPELTAGLGAVSLDVEMETGTGKTYCYIKTMFELNEAYGWSKFIVVVPSIAIREGVKKSFEITQDHFMEQYGKKARFFVYNSSNLHQLDEFSQNSGINVMIINTQAFNTTLNEDKNVAGRSGTEAARIIYTKRDEFGSRRPIDVIKANHPIIILDEPQKMGGTATQNALKKNFNPLFSLNYSATHRTSHNLVYVLDALDAFKKKLVKKIEVKGFELKNLGGTSRYLYVVGIIIDRSKPPRVRLELEVKHSSGIKREIHIMSVGENLYTESKDLEEYKGISIAEIDPIRAIVTFSNGDMLGTGEASGLTKNDEYVRRIQIRETIISHFDKEEELFAQNIKCLSLFFIDEVKKYRQYTDDGIDLLGDYGKIFEDEYTAVLNEKLSLFNIDTAYGKYLRGIETADTHRGYFSIDKKGQATNSKTARGSEFSDDISAYDLILKNKERLLSFDEPTRFIFSHSALREGWDNPNVFQICTLKHSENVTAKRQEVGRGLRLCVDGTGERQDAETCGEYVVHGINKLTVIASESYASFVAGLQSEIKADLFERPTKASVDYFNGRVIKIDGAEHKITESEARGIYNYLVKNDYVDDDGAVTDTYRNAVADGNLVELKSELLPLTANIHKLVQAIFDPSVLADLTSNGNETKVPKPLGINDNWKDFEDLWSRINKRYAYTCSFESAELIGKSIAVIDKELSVARLSYTLTRGEQTEAGIDFKTEKARTKPLDRARGNFAEYDLIGKVAAGTTLTRRTVTAILTGIKTELLWLFRENPEEFISKVTGFINRQKANVVVSCITYAPSAEEPYTKDIFNMSRDSDAYAKAFKAKHAIQDYVFTDGVSADSVERCFVEALDIADEVIVYAKLPRGNRGFYIPTPVGNYSPDWAISFKKGMVKHIFFIAETKGRMTSTQFGTMLRKDPIEEAKIKCAKKLWNNLSTNDVKYHDVGSYSELLTVMETL